MVANRNLTCINDITGHQGTHDAAGHGLAQSQRQQ
jgi:hypothetical protein